MSRRQEDSVSWVGKNKKGSGGLLPFTLVTNREAMLLKHSKQVRCKCDVALYSGYCRRQVPGVERVDGVRETAKVSPLKVKVPPVAWAGAPDQA